MTDFDEWEEVKVRAGLKDRPAGVIYAIERLPDKYHAFGTFAALFNGAQQGFVWPNGGAFFGKAEAEWGWPHAWEQLKAAGLIDYTVSDNKVAWSITEKGWEVRKDDLAYYKELSAAIEADEADFMDERPGY